MENYPKINKEDLLKGYILAPYITKIVKTSINGETVWCANKWKNLLLKTKHFFVKPKYLKNAHMETKHFFVKPKYLKNAHIYKNKVINSSYYGVIKIGGENKTTQN